MSKPLRIALIIIGSCVVAGFIFYIVVMMSFSGAFDKKYTREELTQNFARHESDFRDLVTYFKSQIPPKLPYTIYMSQNGRNKISFYLSPVVIDPKNRIMGATDVKVDSP